jgi:fumarylacetoacetate (FAA) hydrolase family protein
MKLILTTLVLAFTLQAHAETANCNRETHKVQETHILSVREHEVPDGQCHYLGTVLTIKHCAIKAQEAGASCFQVTTGSTTPKLSALANFHNDCYGCD